MSVTSSSYITFPISTDWNDLATTAIQQLAIQYPGWVPAEGNLETWLIYVLSLMEAQTRDVASQVPTAIFRYFGGTIMNIQPIDGAAASAPSTWVMRDASGYTIPAGALVAFQPSGSSQSYFTVQNDVVVAPGQTTTGTGEVTLISTQLGAQYNGYPAEQIALVDSLAFVASVTTTDVTAGGADVESDSDYLNRLRAELQLLSPRPILPNDFATLAKNVPGVGRTIAIDGYNPSNETSNNERMVTVAVAAADGTAVGSTTKAAVASYLESLREVNFVINVVDPSYTAVNVTATLKALPGFDTSAIQSSATTALTDYLSPLNWDWSPTVRFNELIAVLSNIPGVDYVDTLSQPAADVALPGVAALVEAGTISISVLAG